MEFREYARAQIGMEHKETEKAGGAMEEVGGPTEEAGGATPCAYIMPIKRAWLAILTELHLTLLTKIIDYNKERVTKLNPKFCIFGVSETARHKAE